MQVCMYSGLCEMHKEATLLKKWNLFFVIGQSFNDECLSYRTVFQLSRPVTQDFE